MSAGHDTGVALVNPGSGTSVINLQAFQPDGTTAAATTATLNLSTAGHTARFARQMVAGLPSGFVGVLELSSATPFAAATMRSLTNERGDFLFTTFPVADATRPAPVPIVFPQIADGGPYSTQVILLGGTGPATLSIEYTYER